MRSKRARRILLVVAGVVAVPSAALAVLSLLATRPPGLGVRKGRLASCPDTPNCISTQSDDPRHAIAPIPFTGSAEEAAQRLRTALHMQPRVTIVKDQDRYIHAEARSWVFRFVDDLEFLIEEAEGLIHFRSASRVGFGDFGVNRRRAEAIRAAFELLGRTETD